MTYQEIAIPILSTIGGLLGGYLGAYFRKKGENLATKDDIGEITNIVEKVKAEIAKQSEQFKSELNIAVNRRSRLYEIRIEVIKDLYTLAHKVNASMQQFGVSIAPPGKSKEELKKEIDENFNISLSEFNNYYISNSIFLTEELDTLCAGILKTARTTFFDIKEVEFLKLHGETDRAVLKESNGKKVNALLSLVTEIPKQLEVLKNEFIKVIDP